jgi:Lamin Tail Domain
MDNFSKQISSFLSSLKTIYDQQSQLGKILIPGLFLFVFCCFCSILIGVLPSRNSPPPVPSPNIFPTISTQPTPTALFKFEFPTFTPFPTFPPSTALPTLTPLPTGTATLTPTAPTATVTLFLTNTATQPPPTPTIASGSPLRIVDVDKVAEYVDIENLTSAPVDLRGWRLVSEVGNQSCALRGTLQPNRVLRIWAHQGDPGFDCRFPNNIWRDNEPDPAVLYNPQGQQVSRFPY